MIRILFLLACSLPLSAQLRVLATPEPPEVLKALNLRGLALWDVMVCNDGATHLNVAPERIRMLLPALRVVDPARAQAVLQTAVKRSKAATAARLLGYGAALATTFTGSGMIAANAKTVASLALGTVVLTQGQKWTEASVPDTTPYLSNGLTAPIDLNPGACATRTVFAARTRGAKPLQASEPAPLQIAQGDAKFEFGFPFANFAPTWKAD